MPDGNFPADWRVEKELRYLHNTRNIPYAKPENRKTTIIVLKRHGVKIDEATLAEVLNAWPKDSKKKGLSKLQRLGTEDVHEDDADNDGLADEHEGGEGEDEGGEDNDLSNANRKGKNVPTVHNNDGIMTPVPSRQSTPGSQGGESSSAQPPAVPPTNNTDPAQPPAVPPTNDTTDPAQQADATPPNNAVAHAPKCAEDQVLAFFKTVKAMTEIMINDPEIPGLHSTSGKIYGRHPTCQSKVAVALPGLRGDRRHLRGYWVDCRSEHASYFAEYKTKGHNYIIPRASKDDLLGCKEISLILVLKMPWGKIFHFSGLFIADGVLLLASKSVMIEVWGKSDTGEILYEHARRAGQTDLDDLAPRKTRARAQRGPPRPEPFNF